MILSCTLLPTSQATSVYGSEKSRNTALGAIWGPIFDRHQGSVSTLTIPEDSPFYLWWPRKPSFSHFFPPFISLPYSFHHPLFYTKSKNKCKAKEKMSWVPALWSTMLRACIHELLLLSNNCMKYDSQFINGETKAERGMWPAQGHTAITVEHDLNSRQAGHACYTIPGVPVCDVLWGCSPGEPGAMYYNSLLDYSWTLP